jgi:hypothetical protein
LNTLKYVSVYGSSASTTDGVIKFATSTSGNGNDNNLIDNCAVTNSSGNRPVNAIYSLGSAASDNSSNTSNNAIYDFINSSTSSNGIYLRIQPLGQSQPIVLRDNQFCALSWDFSLYGHLNRQCRWK